MKVILVGNGYSVMDNEMGEYIDSNFDLVYRINRFKTKGFEKYVGKRVDGWFIADTGIQWLASPSDDIEGSKRYKDFKYVFVYMPKFKHTESVLNMIDESDKSKCEVQLLPTKHEDKIKSLASFGNLWPTTGLVTIQFLLEKYDKIYLHGFDGCSKKYEYIHYFDKGDETRTTKRWYEKFTGHNADGEKEILTKYRKTGKIIDIE